MSEKKIDTLFMDWFIINKCNSCESTTKGERCEVFDYCSTEEHEAFKAGYEANTCEQEPTEAFGIGAVSNSLDLRELERRLDESLGKETRETLTEWLKQQRQ